MHGQAQTIVDLALSKLKRQDLEHRGFLKPLQIKLNTQFTPQTRHKPGSLPDGIKIVFKDSIINNKFQLFEVVEIGYAPQYSQMKKNMQDNLLTMMKRKEGIEVAICVCMYSENKRMLKSTLAGIKENIERIVTKENICSDKIGVFVMMDGIEKVDPSIVEFFEELQRENNINLGENIVRTLSLQEMEKRAREKTEQEINQQQLKNVNNFLFTPAELQQRNLRRFSTVKEQYDNIRKLLSEINELQYKKPLLDDLPLKIRLFFVKEARNKYQQQYNLQDSQINKLSQQKILDEYINDIKKMRSIMMKALISAKNYCIQYITTKQDLAYLASYRVRVQLKNKQANSSNNQQTQRDNYQDEPASMIEGRDKKQTHMNLFLCVKYRNSGKLSSHNWFFNGFCRELRPKYAILLDVGLRPQAQALYKMYKHMKTHPRIGGVCGYMSIKTQQLQQNQQIKDEQIDFLTSIASKFTNIQRTQEVQYHFAHLIDKPFQASFGFIHVLPGAYSAYNMNAIIKYDEEDDELLKSYFKSIDTKKSKPSPTQFTIGSVLARILLPDFLIRSCIDIKEDSEQQMLYNENIYLAEDRILCMGIHKKGFDMAFLPDAYAEVDPMKTVHGLLGQRKRWINGSFFAFERVKQQLRQHQQNNGFECFLHLQMLYLTIMNMLSYLAPAFFLFTVHIAMQAFRDDVLPKLLQGVTANVKQNQFYNGFVSTIDFIYVMMICSVIFYSLHLNNNHQKYKSYLYAISTIFGIFSLIVFIVLFVDIIRGIENQAAFLTQNQSMLSKISGGVNTINILRWILIFSTGIYVFPIIIYIVLYRKLGVLFDIAFGSLSFLFFGPTYLNILNIYALCRIDDISWGTKGLDTGVSNNDQALKNSWKKIKFIHVGKHIFWNIIVGAIFLSVGSNYAPRFYITIAMVAIMSTSLAIKILIGSLYMIKYKLSNCHCCKQTPNNERKYERTIQQTMRSCHDQIRDEIRRNLEDIQKEFNFDDNFRKNGGSFIQASRKKNVVKRSFQKIKKEQTETKSKIVENNQRNLFSLQSLKNNLQTIKEQENDDSYYQQKKIKKSRLNKLIEEKIEQAPEKQESIVFYQGDRKQRQNFQANGSRLQLNQSYGSSEYMKNEDNIQFKQGKRPLQKKYQKQKKFGKK